MSLATRYLFTPALTSLVVFIFPKVKLLHKIFQTVLSLKKKNYLSNVMKSQINFLEKWSKKVNNLFGKIFLLIVGTEMR